MVLGLGHYGKRKRKTTYLHEHSEFLHMKQITFKRLSQVSDAKNGSWIGAHLYIQEEQRQCLQSVFHEILLKRDQRFRLGVSSNMDGQKGV